MPFAGPPGVVWKSRAEHWAQEANEKNIREDESSSISRRAENKLYKPHRGRFY